MYYTWLMVYGYCLRSQPPLYSVTHTSSLPVLCLSLLLSSPLALFSCSLDTIIHRYESLLHLILWYVPTISAAMASNVTQQRIHSCRTRYTAAAPQQGTYDGRPKYIAADTW